MISQQTQLRSKIDSWIYETDALYINIQIVNHLATWICFVWLQNLVLQA